MLEKQIIKLHFTSPLHLSRGKANLEESFQSLHSDTLKSAIFYNALMLFGEADIFGGEQPNTKFLDAFTISSGFPFYDKALFFPKPQLPLPAIIDDEPEGLEEIKQRKTKKKIQYLDIAHFEKLLQGTLSSIHVADLFLNKRFLASNQQQFFSEAEWTAWLKKEEERKKRGEFDSIPLETTPFFQSDIVQKVMVPRVTSEDATTFYMDRIFFKENAGLFFFIEYHEDIFPDIKNKVGAALNLLGENGLGSDRSTGNGHFYCSSETIALNLATTGQRQLNLSLYCPEKSEERNEMEGLITADTAYTLIKRGGFIASPAQSKHLSYRKKSIFMFKEGSIFPAKDLKGKLVNLRPTKIESTEDEVNHAVWRDGRAIFLPVNA